MTFIPMNQFKSPSQNFVIIPCNHYIKYPYGLITMKMSAK